MPSVSLGKYDQIENERIQYVENRQDDKGMKVSYKPLPKTWSKPKKNSFNQCSGETEPSGNVPEFSSRDESEIYPLPRTVQRPGRTGDIAKFYSSSRTKYIGKASDHQSLTACQMIYYTQCRIAGLSGSGLHCLIYMIDTKSIVGFFYMNYILGRFTSLEDAFYILFRCPEETTQSAIYLREWRSFRIDVF